MRLHGTGKGAQGEICAAWLAVKGQERRPVAVKKFARAAEGTHEIKMHMSAGRHPSVVELRALCQHGTALYLIMELLPRQDLCLALALMDFFPDVSYQDHSRWVLNASQAGPFSFP